MDRFAKAFVLMLLIGGVVLARGEPVTYKLDPTHTWATWAVRHFGTSTYRGRFDRKEGTVTIDRAARTGRVELTIDVTSVDTGVELLNNQLKDVDFFDAGRYPKATFVGEEFRFNGDDVSQVRGQLTLKGTTRPVTLKALSFNCYQNPLLKREVCGGDFSTTISRSDWGINFGAPFPLGDEVRLDIEVEGIRE